MKTRNIGDVSVTQILEWEGLGLTPEQMFPTSKSEDWTAESDWLDPQHWSREENRVRIVSETWLLRSAGRVILVDTGVGNFKDRPNFPLFHQFDGPYLSELAQAGVSPEDVDLVVSTHLHVDHVGWNTRLEGDDWVPTFPRATYLFSRPDVDYWNPDNEIERPGAFVNAGMFADSVQPILDAGLAAFWDDTYTIDENLRLELAPGHTPGNAVLTLASHTDRAVFVGDMIHSPWQIGHSSVSSCFCEDGAAAAASRERVLGWAADHNALVLPGHFAGANALEVSRSGGGFAIKSWASWAEHPAVAAAQR